MNIIIKGELKIETQSGLKISAQIIELLKLIEQTGSLNTAVKELGVSYSHAWNSFYKINCQLNEPLIITQRGGIGGGVAALTESGKKLLQQYEKLKIDFHHFLNEHMVELAVNTKPHSK